jgi:long-chain fatty acid transport protein
MGKHHILGTTALIALVVTTSQASAGGLAIREQSAWGEGASYAGVAAGGSPSAMFWNPATTTQNGKFALENSVSMIFPQTTQTGTNNLPPAPPPIFFNDGIPNSSEPAIVAAGYASMQLNDRLWLGFSLNSPFGLSVGFNNPNWAGAFYGESSTLKTYNASPSVAYKVTEWLSVGVGFHAQYGQANLRRAIGGPIPGFSSPNVNLAQLTGDGWGFGYTAGVTLTPTPWTQIGVGYRSAMDQSINGSLTTNGFGGTPGPIATTLKLPDSVNLGIRQGIMSGLTALGTVEWTGWRRIGTSNVVQGNGAPALVPAAGTPGVPVTIPFQWHDGWFYSIGLEYVAAPAWTVRGGIGYEISPVTDLVRIPLLPDNNRIWYSVGLTNNVTPGVSVDLAYSFVDVQNATVNVVPGNPSFNGLVTYTGTSKASISIFSVGVKFKLGEPPAAVATRG